MCAPWMSPIAISGTVLHHSIVRFILHVCTSDVSNGDLWYCVAPLNCAVHTPCVHLRCLQLQFLVVCCVVETRGDDLILKIVYSDIVYLGWVEMVMVQPDVGIGMGSTGSTRIVFLVASSSGSCVAS